MSDLRFVRMHALVEHHPPPGVSRGNILCAFVRSPYVYCKLCCWRSFVVGELHDVACYTDCISREIFSLADVCSVHLISLTACSGYRYPYRENPLLDAGTVTSAGQVLFSTLLEQYSSRNCEILLLCIKDRFPVPFCTV